MLFSGWFIGVCSWNANVSEHSVCSIFIGRWLTHKKAYDIQNTAKVWNQQYTTLFNAPIGHNCDVAISIWVSGTTKEVDKTLTNSWYIGVSHRVENEADATIIGIQASVFVTHSICTALIFLCGVSLMVLEMYEQKKTTSACTYLVPCARSIWLWFNDQESITGLWHQVGRLWGQLRLLLNGCRGYCLLVKQPKLQNERLSPFSTEFKFTRNFSCSVITSLRGVIQEQLFRYHFTFILHVNLPAIYPSYDGLQ
jgi:hypothetical protein